MKKEDRNKFDKENWRYNNEEDTSIFSLVVWGLMMAGIASLMFWLFI
jgi:hypothetical protein